MTGAGKPALPPLSAESEAHLAWWRRTIAARGATPERYLGAADRLDEEAQSARDRLAQIEPVIAHLRYDAEQANTGSTS